MSDLACHICSSSTVRPIHGLENLHRVTSDCRPWPRGGRLAVCEVCGTVQKPVDDEWRAGTKKIYSEYVMYEQGGGEEQRVFDLNSGQAAARSDRLVHHVREAISLSQNGRLLDFGCGNGAILRAFSKAEPGWRLYGLEQNEKYRRHVENIERVERMYACPLDDVPGRFDIITMLHVLEHIESPIQFLIDLRKKLTPNGLPIVDLPDFTRNPFDLLIADHCTHFTPQTLQAAIERAGFSVEQISTEWIPKEISLVARMCPEIPKETSWPQSKTRSDAPSICVNWLNETVQWARKSCQDKEFGLFGTSIAAVWMDAELEGRAHFFVDEDPNRIGAQHRNRPVYSPNNVPENSIVLLPLAPYVAGNLRNRLAKDHPAIDWRPLPSFPLCGPFNSIP